MRSSNLASAADENYRLGPEDVIFVSVWGNKELTMEVVVRPDGKISIPLVQDVQAEGLTAGELADVIQQELLIYIKDPSVTIIVKKINASKFYIVGYVNKPGTYPLRGDLTILQAISLAGGFSQFASPRKIRLVRINGSRQEVRMVNYYRMIDKGGEGNYLLKPGDTLVVP
jgi:polysaccharide export outer membrane protein